MLSHFFSRLLPLGIGLTLLGSGCLPTQPILNTPTPSSTASLPTGWQTFIDPAWKVSVSYPPDVVSAERDDTVTPGATLGGDFLGYFEFGSFPKNTTLEQASLSVLSTCPTNDEFVTTLSDSKILPKTLTLDGRTFILQAGSDAAMSHYARHQVYMYKEGNQCLRFALSTFEVSADVFEPAKRPQQFDPTDLQKLFLDILKTVHF